jgi:acetyl-CoA synthetase
MAGRVPELYATALGTLKAGLIFTPLFSAFGPEPVRTRMEIGGATVLVTTESIYKRKIASWARRDPDAEADPDHRRHAPEGCVALGPRWTPRHPGSRPWRRHPKTRADPLHLRHHGQAQRRGACAQRGDLPRLFGPPRRWI